MTQLPLWVGCVHAPARQTSAVHARPSSAHDALSLFDQADVLTPGWQLWQAFAAFGAFAA